ncbi:hypothetical protein MMC30_007424 [Trapelia coarctata]|nr:hypothetical protein [Trapelia coarctata]
MSRVQSYLSLVGDSADVTSPSYWSNYDFYTTLNSKATRNVFTTAFVVLNLLVGLLAVLLLKRRNQLQLLRGKNPVVPLNRLSSWMSATDTIIYALQTRRLPGGIFGLFMLSTGVFGIVHQFFVSSFITSTEGLYGQCLFTDGIVTRPPFVGIGTNGTLSPASSWPASDVAINAQLSAVKHGDPPGIYAKANSDTNFTVAKDNADYLGSWNCTDLNNSTSYPPTISLNDITADLNQKGFQYDEQINETGNIQNIAQEGLLIWSPCVPSYTRQLWDIKASIAPVRGVNETIVMYNLNCKMAAPAVEWVLEMMPSMVTLNSWTERAYGRLVYGSDILPPGDQTTFAFNLEVMLNAMVMATASGNNATSTVTSASKSQYNGTDTFRCATQRTVIAFPIWLVLGFLILHFVGFLLADIIMVLIICCYSKSGIVSDIPSDMPSWQLATLRDRFPQEPAIEAKRMHEYVYGWCPNHKRLQFKEKAGAQGQGLDKVTTAYQPVQTFEEHHDLASLNRKSSPRTSIHSVSSP